MRQSISRLVSCHLVLMSSQVHLLLQRFHIGSIVSQIVSRWMVLADDEYLSVVIGSYSHAQVIRFTPQELSEMT